MEFPSEYKERKRAIDQHLPEAVKQTLLVQTDSQYNVTGFEVVGDISLEDAMYAMALLEKAMEPASGQAISFAVKRMMKCFTTIPGNEEKNEEKASAYMTRLTVYPEDIVNAACNAMADIHEYPPAWVNIKRDCEWRMSPRRYMHKALSDYVYWGRRNGK